MKRNCGVVLLCLLLTAPFDVSSLAQGASPQRPARASAISAQSSAPELDACRLLTTAEIISAQGSPVVEMKPDLKSQGDFVLSECLFRSETFAKSVSLALALPGPSAAADSGPRRFWQSRFHAASVTQSREPAVAGADASRGEQEQNAGQVRSVPGLGEEAYWVSDPILGALYVLQGDTFLRVSVGGEKVELDRLRKSKLLAGLALQRLQERAARP